MYERQRPGYSPGRCSHFFIDSLHTYAVGMDRPSLIVDNHHLQYGKFRDVKILGGTYGVILGVEEPIAYFGFPNFTGYNEPNLTYHCICLLLS